MVYWLLPSATEGLGSFRKATVELLLGADSPAIKEGRVATLQVWPDRCFVCCCPVLRRVVLRLQGWALLDAVHAFSGRGSVCLPCTRLRWPTQALSGTGSLRVGAAFIAKFLPAGTVAYISRPTWGNHKNILADAGVAWKEYRWVGAGLCKAVECPGLCQAVKLGLQGGKPWIVRSHTLRKPHACPNTRLLQVQLL